MAAIPGIHSPSQPIIRRVSDLERCVKVTGSGKRQHGSENLLLHNSPLRIDIGNDRRTDKPPVSFGLNRSSASNNSAFRLSELDILKDGFVGALAYDRPRLNGKVS